MCWLLFFVDGRAPLTSGGGSCTELSQEVLVWTSRKWARTHLQQIRGRVLPSILRSKIFRDPKGERKSIEKLLIKTETYLFNLSSSYYLHLAPPQAPYHSHLPLHQRSSPPSMPPYQNSVRGLRHLPRQTTRSSSAAPRIRLSSRDPLHISRQSFHLFHVDNDISPGRKKGRNILLSNRYGIPTTKARPTTAMRIIGFFSRLSGETIHLESAFAHPACLSNPSFPFFIRTRNTHTQPSPHRTPSS